jgi:hypothetical protein
VDTLVDELFTAAQIVALCGVTPSVKTHHLLMEVLVPRCVDPSEGSTAILAVFRFQEDKEIVHEALKVTKRWWPMHNQRQMAATFACWPFRARRSRDCVFFSSFARTVRL